MRGVAGSEAYTRPTCRHIQSELGHFRGIVYHTNERTYATPLEARRVRGLRGQTPYPAPPKRRAP